MSGERWGSPFFLFLFELTGFQVGWLESEAGRLRKTVLVVNWPANYLHSKTKCDVPHHPNKTHHSNVHLLVADGCRFMHNDRVSIIHTVLVTSLWVSYLHK